MFVYQLNFRLSGKAIGIPLATIEFAILDLLGRIAGKPKGELIGETHHPQVAVYQATEYQEKPVEESLELIKRDVAEYNARALKIKVGGLMFMTADMPDLAPTGGRRAAPGAYRSGIGNRLRSGIRAETCSRRGLKTDRRVTSVGSLYPDR